MQSLRPKCRHWLAALQSRTGDPAAHRAQMQTFPCASAGIEANALGLMLAVMHQHDSGSRPAAAAHSFGSPHGGHWAGPLGLGRSVI